MNLGSEVVHRSGGDPVIPYKHSVPKLLVWKLYTLPEILSRPAVDPAMTRNRSQLSPKKTGSAAGAWRPFLDIREYGGFPIFYVLLE